MTYNKPEKSRIQNICESRNFTLIELITVLTIIAILAALVLPQLGNSRVAAKLARWKAYSNNLRADRELMLYYNFEQDQTDKLENKSIGIESESFFVPSSADGELTGRHLPEWGLFGRWKGKKGLYFNGASKVLIKDSKYFGKTDQLTVEIWCKPFTSVGQHGIITKWTARTGGPFLVRLWRNNKLTFFIQTGEEHNGRFDKDYTGITSKTSIPKNSWAYIVGVYNGKTLSIYINGKLDASKNWSGTVVRGIPDTVIGEDRNNSYPFVGIIDEIAVYKRALSPTEIKNHYEIGSP
jgi:prepilin-type N-terminal cleavage/methylation domain-containing protein